MSLLLCLQDICHLTSRHWPASFLHTILAEGMAPSTTSVADGNSDQLTAASAVPVFHTGLDTAWSGYNWAFIVCITQKKTHIIISLHLSIYSYDIDE